VERGFRIANPVRIIGQEDALLSVSNRSPVVWIDLTDYIMPNAVSQVREPSQRRCARSACVPLPKLSGKAHAVGIMSPAHTARQH